MYVESRGFDLASPPNIFFISQMGDFQKNEDFV
jgi:hypothetical protein